jgi:hypothetical protein
MAGLKDIYALKSSPQMSYRLCVPLAVMRPWEHEGHQFAGRDHIVNLQVHGTRSQVVVGNIRGRWGMHLLWSALLDLK